MTLNPSRNCRFDGCGAVIETSGYCRPHYHLMWDRTHRQTGTQPGWKLTDEQVAEIRKRSSRFQSPRAIADAMGISDRTVRKYLKAK